MQSADDRDEYITILWDNIQDKHKSNYKKYTSSHFGASYDYLSIMHYNAYGFAKDKKKPTMMPHVRLKFKDDNKSQILFIHIFL